MNEYDKENLNFLLSCSLDELKHWYDAVDEDDHEYASELMTIYSAELALKESMLEDKVEGTDQAVEYLKNFLLKK